jgi:hypothetical protein
MKMSFWKLDDTVFASLALLILFAVFVMVA